MKVRKPEPFVAVVHNTQIRFTVPVETIRRLRLEHKHKIHLVLKSAGGRVLFNDVHPMKSPREIYGKAMRKILKQWPEDQRARVAALNS